MNYTITDIETLTEQEAQELASETLNIKGFTGYLIDFDGYFGYSLVVFKNNHQIRYANDYKLHHAHESIEELKNRYINRMNTILFTDSELLSEIKNYDDYSKKSYFVRNYWILQFDHVSMFHIGDDEEYKNAVKACKYTCNECFCYVNDENIVISAAQYINHLEKGYKAILENVDLFRTAISYELANHEACITYSINEAMGALGLSRKNVKDWQIAIAKQELNKQIEAYNKAE